MHSIVTTSREAVIKVEVANFGAAIDTLIDQDATHSTCWFIGCRLIGGSDYKLIYRHYATLYFVFCVDSSESELGILDLIQVLDTL